MSIEDVLPRLANNGFDLCSSRHADAILGQDFADAAREIGDAVNAVAIPILEVIAGGGGEAKVTQRLRAAFNDLQWTKRSFRVEKRIDGELAFSESHLVDHTKSYENGTIAMEIEWNNKDPFFDRDLENFSRLHADGGISLGVIVTRGRTLQAGLATKIREFAVTRGIQSFADLEHFGVAPTPRQRRAVERAQEANGWSFDEAWAVSFARDKFGTATTHWSKLMDRLDRGVGSPCPMVGIGIPLDRLRPET